MLGTNQDVQKIIDDVARRQMENQSAIDVSSDRKLALSTIDRSKQSQMFCPSVVDLESPDDKQSQKKKSRSPRKRRAPSKP